MAPLTVSSSCSAAASVTVSGSRLASAPRRLRILGCRSRCKPRRGRVLRRVARHVVRAAAVSPSLVVSKCQLGRVATDDFDREERGARAAAEFLRRAAAVRELPPCPVHPAVARALRRVTFTEEPPSVLEVVPYCEIYGLHPREFVFCRNYGMVPAQGQFGFNGFDFVAYDVDDEEDEEDDHCETSAPPGLVRESGEESNDESDDEFGEFDDCYF